MASQLGNVKMGNIYKDYRMILNIVKICSIFLLNACQKISHPVE